jgi:V/A-type H+-transporting ATPase subunit A
MLPPGVEGTITEIQSGDFNVDTPIAQLSDGTPVTLAHRWPVRKPRPVATRGSGTRPFITGQRIFDFLFPIAEGGTVAVPGGFGTGKTVIEQSLAKFAEADIVVYIACGERGNEAAEALTEFRELIDPRTGSPVMDRAVLVVNTSNMPVAARDSSVFYGMTVAEYYRDMGYRVAVMADSLSRWAEALREVATRLQEMPGEEGYPTYLASRLGKLYERAGTVTPTGKPERTGAITFIGAISPPGGEFSEPVTQASLRVVGGLWALDAALAHRRQFPAVNWEESYSLYSDGLAKWFADEIAEDWMDLRRETLELLERDTELQEIAGLVGPDALEDKDRLVMEVARLVRETILGQSAFDPNDAFSPPKKTHRLAALVHDIHATCRAALDRGADFDHLDLGTIRRALVTLRSAPSTEFDNRAAQVDVLIATIGEMET